MGESLSPAQNSELRKKINGPLGGLAHEIHCCWPGLDPNHVTLGALVLMAGLTGVQLARDKRNWKYTIGESSFYTLAELMISGLDMIDGALAREMGDDRDPKKARVGKVLDPIGDRLSELMRAGLRFSQAGRRGDKLGEFAALLAMTTNSLPSLTRSWAEENGGVTSENGTNLLEFFGTKFGRTILQLVTNWPDAKIAHGVRAQTVVDLWQAGANAAVGVRRLAEGVKAKKNKPDKETVLMRDATKRRQWLVPIAVGGIGLATILAWRSQKRVK